MGHPKRMPRSGIKDHRKRAPHGEKRVRPRNGANLEGERVAHASVAEIEKVAASAAGPRNAVAVSAVAQSVLGVAHLTERREYERQSLRQARNLRKMERTAK